MKDEIHGGGGRRVEEESSRGENDSLNTTLTEASTHLARTCFQVGCQDIPVKDRPQDQAKYIISV